MTWSEKWRAYAGLQGELDRTHRVDSRAWGVEAGLDALLASDEPTDAEALKTVATAARRERHQAASRRNQIAPATTSAIVEPRLEARATLRLIESAISSTDRVLVFEIAEGWSYQELALRRHVSPGSLRVRVARIRQHIEQQRRALDPAA